MAGNDLTLRKIPALRPNPMQEGPNDAASREWGWRHWESQTVALRLRDRVIEENIRVLCGQQWVTWNSRLQRYVDITHTFTDEEKRFRQRPTFNRLLGWYILTHARLVENPPIVTFLPGPDRIDSELAETMDVVYKALWRDCNMVDVNDRLWSWVIAAGTGYLSSRIDLTKGELEPWIGPATLPLQLQPGGNPIADAYGDPIEEEFPEVPFGPDGQPRAFFSPDGLQVTGEPHEEREGELVVDVLSPFEVRGEWGPTPWHQKRWHAQLSFLTPEQVFELYGVECVPDVTGPAADSTGEMERMLYGAGFFGAATQKAGTLDAGAHVMADGYCRVLTFWHAPVDNVEGMRETRQNPGGRLLICTKDKTFYDGPRPVKLDYTSPIHRFDFIRLPGRPSGTTPLEMMVGPQRAYNKGWAMILEHRALVTNPIALVDSRAGLANVTITNQPGKKYTVTGIPGVKPMEWLAPPQLGKEVQQTQADILNELIDLGNLRGTEGETPSRDASGELVKELRFNSDRFLGPTVRRAVETYARVVKDWIKYLPILWSREKILSVAGEDNVARTTTVYPLLFQEGKLNVVPDVESMLPEGRGERQQKVYAMYVDGMFGPPGSPQAVKQFLELSRMPHLSRAARPGGANRSTAEQFLGRMLMGEPLEAFRWLPWYEVGTWLDVYQTYMCSPEFVKLDPMVQQTLGMWWQMMKTEEAMMLMAMAPPAPPQGTEGGSPPKGGAAGGSGPESGLFMPPASSRLPSSAGGYNPSSV